MKSFRVQGSNWYSIIEIDNTIIEKDRDMACEAATQAIEHYLNRNEDEVIPINNENPALGPFVIADEVTDNPNAQSIMFLTERLLKNAGKHQLAKDIRAEIIKRYKQIKDKDK